METRRQHGPFQKNQEVEVKQEVSKAIRLSEEAAEQPKILPFILSEKAVGFKCDVLQITTITLFSHNFDIDHG